MSSRRVTLARIAEEAGVSYMTVARALSGKTKAVWPSVAERNDRIRVLAEKLGYQTNSAARATATGRFGSVAFVMRAEKSDFFPFNLLRGVCDTLAAHDTHMMVARIPAEDIERDGYAPKIVREFAVDGLLIHEAKDVSLSVTQMIRRNRVPAVWLNNKLPSDCVFPDELEAVTRVTRDLIAQGHRSIAFVEYDVKWSAPASHYSAADRRAGYAAAMEAAGLATRYERVDYAEAQLPFIGRPWGAPQDDRLERSLAILKSANRPTAIVTPSPDTAGPLLTAAAMLGIGVPRELSLVTVHHEVVSFSGRAISTMVTPMLECGQTGVEMLMQKFADPRRGAPALAVPFGELQGQTAGPAKTREGKA